MVRNWTGFGDNIVVHFCESGFGKRVHLQDFGPVHTLTFCLRIVTGIVVRHGKHRVVKEI